MWYLNRILTAVFDAAYVPMNALPRWVSLTLLSCLVGFLALLSVKYCSNQKAIAKVKDDIKANMLAIKLFKDELGVMFGAQRRLVWAALRMQYHMLPPLLIMLVPFVLLAAQMGLRYQWRAPRVGDPPALLTVTVADKSSWANFDLTVRPDPGFEAFDRLRAVADGTVTWKLRAKRDGDHRVEITKGAASFSKEFSVGDRADRVCPLRPDGNFWDNLLYPAEAPFSKSDPIQSISIRYPARESWYAGSDWWLLWFLIVSMAFALVLKPVLKVKL